MPLYGLHAVKMSARSKKLVDLALAIGTTSDTSSSDEDSVDSDADPVFDPVAHAQSSDSEESSDEEDRDPVAGYVVDSNEEGESSEDAWLPVATSPDLLFPTLCPNDEIATIPLNTRTPLDFYKLFVSDEIIEIMVIETNRYANEQKEKSNVKTKSRLNEWLPTSHEEMHRFFAILLTMGLVSVPKINLYWSKNPIYHNEFISSTMARDRFLLLLKCWHFADNSLDRGTDRLFKLRPLVDHILENFKIRLTPSKSLVIDESMIPWRGRLLFRQYIKNKTHKYGVKLYKLCTVSGYVINFIIYTGKGSTAPGKSHAESIVDSLLENKYGQGHNLYCDNFYTSCKLAEKLINEKTRLCGTVRKNSKGLPREVINEKLRKGQITGKQKGPIKCIKWADKRPVLMVTSFEDHDATVQETGKIKNGQAVMKPKCVMDYNSAKKGVDYR